MIVDRPWGGIVTYALNQPTSVKLITVRPGHGTVPHAHRLRDELWVVLDEGIVVTVGDRVIEAVPGEEVMVPAESPHRIENHGSAPGRVLDVAFGYLSDEDVVVFGEVPEPVEGPSSEARRS
jgi:mannose-1-phosphate guanylyltransferase/mannose-6-phosphate isomerase